MRYTDAEIHQMYRAQQQQQQPQLTLVDEEELHDALPPPSDEYSISNLEEEEIPPYSATLHKYLDMMSFDSRFAPVLRINRYIVNNENKLIESIKKFNEFQVIPKSVNLWDICHIDDIEYESRIPELIQEGSSLRTRQRNRSNDYWLALYLTLLENGIIDSDRDLLNDATLIQLAGQVESANSLSSLQNLSLRGGEFRRNQPTEMIFQEDRRRRTSEPDRQEHRRTRKREQRARRQRELEARAEEERRQRQREQRHREREERRQREREEREREEREREEAREREREERRQKEREQRRQKEREERKQKEREERRQREREERKQREREEKKLKEQEARMQREREERKQKGQEQRRLKEEEEQEHRERKERRRRRKQELEGVKQKEVRRVKKESNEEHKKPKLASKQEKNQERRRRLKENERMAIERMERMTGLKKEEPENKNKRGSPNEGPEGDYLANNGHSPNIPVRNGSTTPGSTPVTPVQGSPGPRIGYSPGGSPGPGRLIPQLTRPSITQHRSGLIPQLIAPSGTPQLSSDILPIEGSSSQLAPPMSRIHHPYRPNNLPQQTLYI